MSRADPILAPFWPLTPFWPTERQPIKLPLHLVSDNTREATRKLGIGEEDPRLGLIARPTTILLDREGKIHWLYIGKSPNDRPSADEILRRLTW